MTLLWHFKYLLVSSRYSSGIHITVIHLVSCIIVWFRFSSHSFSEETTTTTTTRELKGKSREISLPIFFTQLDREFNFKQLSNLFHQKIFTGNAWFFAFKVAFLGKIAWFCCCKLAWIEKFQATSHDNDEVIFHS